MEPLDIRNQKIPADSVAGGDSNLSSGGDRFQQLGFSAADQADGRLNVPEQDLAFCCETDLLGASDKQGLGQLSLQSLDGLTDG